MRVKINSLLYICGIVILASTIETRKIRVRPRPQSLENEDSGVAEDIRTARVQYYAAEEPQEEQQRIILVSEDDYNGLYGQPQAQAQARALQDNYIPHSRNAPKPQPQPISQRTKGSTDAPKQPPVQTIRNYNKVNDDGSFTFGYEAADGSFKEETRGTDCVVRGKYGYVDPDGNKREFTYVSGNPCDPNAINDEDSDERKESGSKSQQEDEDTDDGQANYPKAFPVRPLRPSPSARPTPVPTRPPVTVFQNVYAQSSEEDEEEPLQVLQPQTPRPRLQSRPTPQYIARPQPSPTYQIQTESSRPSYQIQTESSRPSYQIQTESPRPAYQIQPQPTTPSSLVFHQTNSPVNITPRPSTVKAQLPATTYRPQLVAVTPRPAQVYTTKELEPAHRLFPSSTPTPLTRTPSGTIDFQAEFAKFAAQDGNAVVSTPKTLLKSTEKVKPTPFQGSEPIYSSELVYDPSSGQYKTQLYQTLPQTTGDFTLSHRIQPYVQQQQAQQPSRLVSLQQLQQQSPIYRTLPQQSAIPQQRPQPTQQLYQQQQAELQFQNSQQLYAQQQRVRAQAAQRPLPSPASVQQQPQQFYYIQPQTQNQQHALAQGQIEAFLRGHNIDFK